MKRDVVPERFDNLIAGKNLLPCLEETSYPLPEGNEEGLC
jgi:hypothetical protein